MDVKKFCDPLLKLIDSLPDGANVASVGWRADGMLRTVSLVEQYDNPSTWRVMFSEYPEPQKQNQMLPGMESNRG